MKEATAEALTFQDAWGATKSVVGSIDSIRNALNGEGSAWEKVSAVMDGALTIYNTFTALAPAIQAAWKAMTAAKEEDTSANVTNAVSGALSAHSSIPFVGIGLGIAAVAAIIATMLSVPKFAEGGIVHGPTFGLMGEYSGASNNPEVIAPLSRLRQLLDLDGSPSGSPVVVHLEASRGALRAALTYDQIRQLRL